MLFSTATVAAALMGSALAHPVEKRANALPPVASDTDASVLQLALYLEHLEQSLYTGGYENFTEAEYTADGFPAGFRDNVGVIAQVWTLGRYNLLKIIANVLLFSMKLRTPLPSQTSLLQLVDHLFRNANTNSPTAHLLNWST